MNLDRNDGNLLVRSCRTNTGTKYELIPIDHGLSLPDRLEVYADDVAWMSWPQAQKPFGERELAYIRSLNGSRDSRLLSKCLGVRRECLRLMEVTTKLLQIGAEHGLTLYDIGMIMFREDQSDDSQVLSKLEVIIEQCVDMAIATAGDNAAFKNVSSTLAGLDLSRPDHRAPRSSGLLSVPSGPFHRQISGDNLDTGLTPMLGPSSPIASLNTSPLGGHVDVGMDILPHLSLDGLSESDEQEHAAGVERFPSLSGTAARRLKADADSSGKKHGTYKGTMIRAGRSSASLMERHREGEGGDSEGIFCRPKLLASAWTNELEIRGNHLSNTTCLNTYFLQTSGE